jgi:hypothetical protein
MTSKRRLPASLRRLKRGRDDPQRDTREAPRRASLLPNSHTICGTPNQARFDESHRLARPGFSSVFRRTIFVPRTQTFFENRARRNDGRHRGVQGSASKEPFSELFDSTACCNDSLPRGPQLTSPETSTARFLTGGRFGKITAGQSRRVCPNLSSHHRKAEGRMDD